jgi:hypothetical protein
MYDVVGAVSDADARELRAQAETLLGEVLAWLRSARPELAP